MRKFSSYGTVNTKLHYYVPREALVEQAYSQLVGENPEEGGHYITVWAPRQRGKSWIMQQVLQRLRDDSRFDAVMLNLEELRDETDVNQIVRFIAAEIIKELGLSEVRIKTPMAAKGGFLGGMLNWLSYLPFLPLRAFRADPQPASFFASASVPQFPRLFEKDILKKPLILILDDFDILSEEGINALTGVFRHIYLTRQHEEHKPSAEKKYLLHGLALIGRKSLLGIDNATVPYNIQRSFYIPKLTFVEVKQMFEWLSRDSGQEVSEKVIRRIYDKTQGQPAFVSWFGQLLTETYNNHNPTITNRDFERTYAAASFLPNANIEHIERCATDSPYQSLVLGLFRTDYKRRFTLDDPRINFLYMNGVVDEEITLDSEHDKLTHYIKFTCPFVQKRLFNYFSEMLFPDIGELHPPFKDLSDIISHNHLNIKKLMRLYERYLRQNRDWLLKDAPRRATDLRIFEAVYHFNFYMYLSSFLRRRGGRVYPEFPTGNGKIDLIINYAGKKYGIEVKSYTDQTGYKKAITQAAAYGKQLKLAEISLVFFVEAIDDANREKYEVTTVDEETGVRVEAVFVTTAQ